MVTVHDASSASKGRAYSQEGRYYDPSHERQPQVRQADPLHHWAGSERASILVEKLTFCLHMELGPSASATQLLNSETLAAISGLETASLVALRLAELPSPTRKPSLQQLAALQEAGVLFLPVDSMTDCKDLYALTTGRTALPQDKSQRVYILAHREARLSGRLRWIILVPTQSMVADALTKPMLSKQLLHLLSTGQVNFLE